MSFLNSITTQSINGTSKTIKNAFATLRYIRPKKQLKSTQLFSSIYYSERSCLCASSYSNASITLEAAIAVPLFIMAILSVIYIINIMYLQFTLQIRLEETARSLNQMAYISSEFYSLSASQQENACNKDSSLIENLGASLITIPYIQNSFLDDKTKDMLNNSLVINGADGISFVLSSVDMKANTLDIVLTYKTSIPFLSDKLLSFKLSNRCYMQIYMGKDMEKEQHDTSFYVYFTSTGSVCHTNKYCQYLLNYSKAIRYRDSLIQYTLNGCVLCSLNTTIDTLYKTNPVIYLTSDEDTYHTTLDCQSFTKNIFRVKKTSLDDDELCEECKKGK